MASVAYLSWASSQDSRVCHESGSGRIRPHVDEVTTSLKDCSCREASGQIDELIFEVVQPLVHISIRLISSSVT
jgi:hypothetical protein